MNPESIYYLHEFGTKIKQEDYIWPVAGKASANDRVFMVCDGAGSFYNGGIASKLICQFMAAKVLKFDEQNVSGELIDKLLLEARERLITYAREYRLDTDLSTTFSMVILYDQKVFLSWYGDSPIYHVRGGEILFKSEDNSVVHEPIHVSAQTGGGNWVQTKDTTATRGVRADESPISAETKWIEDVQDGDYFMLCSKGFLENVTDDDIKSLLSQNDKENIDLTGSFRRLAIEKTPDNYSMYLMRVNVTAHIKGITNGFIPVRKKISGKTWSALILAMIIIGLLMIAFYFPSTPKSELTPEYKKDTTQHLDALRDDSVPMAVVVARPRRQTPTDTVKSNYEILPPTPAVTDTAKSKTEKAPPIIPEDVPADIQAEDKPEQAESAPIRKKPEQSNETPVVQKKSMGQMLIKFSTDEACKLKITNIELDNVIDWDLAENDNGTIYLKPGRYSIVATSVSTGSKSQTYNFDVKYGETNATQSLHFRF